MWRLEGTVAYIDRNRKKEDKEKKGKRVEPPNSHFWLRHWMIMSTVCGSLPGDFFVVLSVVTLAVQQSIVNNDKRRHEVNQFARRQHAQISSSVPASVAVTVRRRRSRNTLSPMT